MDRRVVATVSGAVGAFLIAGSAAGIAAAAGAGELVVLARALIAGVPAAVGLRTLAHHDNRRFGLALTGAGALLAVTTLAESSDELAYSTGRAAGWLVELTLIYLLLSFPTGRLPTSTDRALVGLTSLVILTLFVPRLALAEHFEVPSPYTGCMHDCPGNAFLLLDHQPALVNGVLRPAGALLMLAVAVAVVLRIRERLRESTPLARRMLVPVLAVGVARMALLGVGFVARQADAGASPVEVIAWTLAFSAPVIGLAFLFALLRWQLDASRGLQRLAEWVREVPDAGALRLAMADAFDDPRLRLALPADNSAGAWVDPEARPVALPGPDGGLVVSEVRDHHDVVVAAVIHDQALRASPRYLEAGLAMAGVVLANQRLVTEAETATREVRRSRMRIAATAERERHRIERDLHDGAQQRLVALRIELELTEELVRTDPIGGIGRLRELGHDVDEALEELRSLAHGVYPPLLADRGLDEAIRIITARCPIPVQVDDHEVGRYKPEVESAVYFCVMEAVQNALKHAGGARRLVVRVDGGFPTQLRFSVRDDGAGSPDDRIIAGAGVTNMRDRLDAVGGELTITSLRSVGTAVRGRIPVVTLRAD